MDAVAQELITRIECPVCVAVPAKRAVSGAVTGRRVEIGMQHQTADMGGLSGPVPFVGDPAVRRGIGRDARPQRGAGRIEQRRAIGVVETTS
jgi:hypothetical protein